MVVDGKKRSYLLVTSGSESSPKGVRIGEDSVASALEDFGVVLTEGLEFVLLEPAEVVGLLARPLLVPEPTQIDLILVHKAAKYVDYCVLNSRPPVAHEDLIGEALLLVHGHHLDALPLDGLLQIRPLGHGFSLVDYSTHPRVNCVLNIHP